MTVIKQQESLLFGPECLPSKHYNEVIRILNLTIPLSDSNNTLNNSVNYILNVGN